jgi:hypothetical protein
MSAKDRKWKWGFFEVRYLPYFWVLAIGVDFERSYDRGIGIGVGPFSFSLVFP